MWLSISPAAIAWIAIVAVVLGYLAYRRGAKSWIWALVGAVVAFVALAMGLGLLAIPIAIGVGYLILHFASSD